VLAGERQSDDGYGQQSTEEDMGKTDPDSADQEPQDIHKYVQTAPGRIPVMDLLSEGPEGHHSQLQGLQTERNAYDGDHQYDTAYEVFNGGCQTSEYQPYNVAEYVHNFRFFYKEKQCKY
jgi:hypothetical protein